MVTSIMSVAVLNFFLTCPQLDSSRTNRLVTHNPPRDRAGIVHLYPLSFVFHRVAE